MNKLKKVILEQNRKMLYEKLNEEKSGILKNKLNDMVSEINAIISKRRRKISFKDVLYFSAFKNLTNDGNEKIICQLKNNFLIDNKTS